MTIIVGQQIDHSCLRHDCISVIQTNVKKAGLAKLPTPSIVHDNIKSPHRLVDETIHVGFGDVHVR